MTSRQPGTTLYENLWEANTFEFGNMERRRRSFEGIWKLIPTTLVLSWV